MQFITTQKAAVGKYADFILINQNVLECDKYELYKTKVIMTFFEGRCVYEAN